MRLEEADKILEDAKKNMEGAKDKNCKKRQKRAGKLWAKDL